MCIHLFLPLQINNPWGLISVKQRNDTKLSILANYIHFFLQYRSKLLIVFLNNLIMSYFIFSSSTYSSVQAKD